MEDELYHKLPTSTLQDYEQYVGAETIDRIRKKVDQLRGNHFTNISSTYYGGGVAELLSSLTILMNSSGINMGWRIIQGSPDFFSITKKMHNALQGCDINLTDRKEELYEHIIFQNAIRNHIHHDYVIVHDPQPLPMILHYKKKGPWLWRCHIDLTNPNTRMWEYLKPFIEMYDGAIVSIPEYKKQLKIPQFVVMPAIDPFSIKNKALSEKEIQERLDHYKIPTDLPLVVQISRFDAAKDPEGVVKAFLLASKKVKATLVLLGAAATDDPEGERIYESLLHHRSERIILMSHEDTALVNALQHKAHVVLQKSLKEGFGLTVTEAMWKGTPVIGGNVGGIKYQIQDGVNGFLVNNVEECADRIVQLISNPDLKHRMGKLAKQSVRNNFLLTRLMEQELDIYNSYETIYRVRS